MAYGRTTLLKDEQKALLAELSAAVEQMRAPEAAWVAWAMAKLKLEDNVVLSKLVKLASAEVGSMDSQSLSHMLWGIAKFGRRTGMAVPSLTEMYGSRG